MNIGEVVGIRQPNRQYALSSTFPTNDRIGIEVEVEGVEGERSEYEYWHTTSDESLRGDACEFITKDPLFGADIDSALAEFCNIRDTLEEIQEWETSIRTGVHVHLEISDISLVEFRVFLMLYITLETILFQISGNRVDNIHCLPFASLDSLMKNMNNFQKSLNLDLIQTPKYVSLNTEPIWRQGTVEIRFHEGTFDEHRISNWIRILLHLKMYCRNNPISMSGYINHISEVGASAFMREVFPRDIAETMSYEGSDADLMEGVRVAQEIIYQDTMAAATIPFGNGDNLIQLYKTAKGK